MAWSIFHERDEICVRLARGARGQAHPSPRRWYSRRQGSFARCDPRYNRSRQLHLDSPTYGQWIAEQISAEEGEQIFVPRGSSARLS
jgi:hypothetical protein